MTDINNKEIIYGKRPIRRTNWKPGQSEWYYLDPRGAETFSDMKQIDVENENAPNPFANEIQNYLYKNDEYNYKLLYGDNPPSVIPAVNNSNILKQFGNNLENIIMKVGLDKMTENLYNLSYDGAERIIYPQDNLNNYENKSSLGLAQAESQRLHPMKISDVNKHQYISCIGAFDGPISVGLTSAAGLYKEGTDLYKKWNNYKYGSNQQILSDSFKDLQNDVIGISRGWSAKDIRECDSLLPINARRK